MPNIIIICVYNYVYCEISGSTCTCTVCYFEFLPHSTSKQLRQQQDYRHLISPTVILLKILYLHHCAIFNKKKQKKI